MASEKSNAKKRCVISGPQHLRPEDHLKHHQYLEHPHSIRQAGDPIKASVPTAHERRDQVTAAPLERGRATPRPRRPGRDDPRRLCCIAGAFTAFDRSPLGAGESRGRADTGKQSEAMRAADKQLGCQ